MSKNLSGMLPAWGPYSKKYMGISHVPDTPSLPGARFDCVVFPTMANSGVPVPNVTVPSNYHPWNASGDLSFIEYRYDLEWKDRVYADISFTRINTDAVLIRSAFVNHSELSQNCLLNYFCAIEYPDREYCLEHLPSRQYLWSATDYAGYAYAKPRPWDAQNPDGAKKGEFRDPAFTEGCGLGDRVDASHVPQLAFRPFGAECGDTVSYQVSPPQSFDDAVLGIRYRTKNAGSNTACVVQSSGFIDNELSFPPTDTLTVLYVHVGKVAAKKQKLSLYAVGGGCGLELDCFFLIESGGRSQASFEMRPFERIPEVGYRNGTVLYRYPGIDRPYGFTPLTEKVRYRDIPTGALEDALISRLSNPDPTFDDVTEPFTRSFARKHTNEGFYHNVIIPSIFIEPGGTHVEYAIVCDGSPVALTAAECEKLYLEGRAPEAQGLTAAGKPYEFSNRLLKSTLLGNVVYPIYKYGMNIKHFTPGKRWDSLYTWDSGFIGLGLLESESRLAEYILDTYLSEPDNPDYAFLFHGSPVPTQIYLYLELLNRANDKSGLFRYYERARLFYEFLVGRTHGSTVARFQSGLTSTYDLFYSTSGMDDYPAQVYVHQHGLERCVTPCISASHAIRCGKILKMIAAELGRPEDTAQYDADILRLTQALRTFAWDADAGYFGYVIHDVHDEPIGILKNEDGENLNKGFDGLYPLVAGACTQSQAQVLLAHLRSPAEIFSRVGLSAVDMTSGYYRDDGYWNGNVWFSHQWFFFKVLLDMAQTELAFQIADTALRAWKREVDASYNCFEMLNITTGRGGWYHQFGGLSAPVNLWANAYYKPDTITTGYDVWIVSRDFAPDHRSCAISLDYHGTNEEFAVIVVMDDTLDRPYRVAVNGDPLACPERERGVLEIKLNGCCRQVNLLIR